ncbi:haloacid dehalogenase-like hydrolase family protein [Rhodococcus sp. MTM3W5.2]|nr:haloacid dehalogenase-like hydrolase family protein [Rhodococcus sp. MTM3W5.2]
MGIDLGSWTDGSTRSAIVDFVERVTTTGGADFVEPADRVAVFDNDGTLWCEKPMPIQLDFTVRRFAEMAAADPALQQQQPWKAAHEHDLRWLGAAMVKHYNGDDGDLKLLMGAVTEAFDSVTVENYDARVRAFFAGADHPTLGRPYRGCGYAPMVELLRYLEANGFANYIASGGDRDFMRPVAGELYGVPPERIIGSALGLSYREGRRRRTCCTRPRWTSSTTDRRSRSGSGAGSDDGRSCRSATPTATCRCSPSPGSPTARPCGR